MTKPLKTGSTIGILGGGQLGRMLTLAAARLGFKSHIFHPSPNSPASEIAFASTVADYEDQTAILDFADKVDVITYEFENIPTQILKALADRHILRPGCEALEVSQDRLLEKEFLNSLGIKTADFEKVDSKKSLKAAINHLGLGSILKTRRLGYDGKGQFKIVSQKDLRNALPVLGSQQLILEKFINFSHEISIIGARSWVGDIVCFDPSENLHENGILLKTRVPANLTPKQRNEVTIIARKILEELNYVGVMGIEFFVADNEIIVNEIAPRVHNSGHWTQTGCVVDQFEQHIRAISGWPLGSVKRHSDIIMENLLGDDIHGVIHLANQPGIDLQIYGKKVIKTNRKMGHFNRIVEKQKTDI